MPILSRVWLKVTNRALTFKLLFICDLFFQNMEQVARQKCLILPVKYIQSIWPIILYIQPDRTITISTPSTNKAELLCARELFMSEPFWGYKMNSFRRKNDSFYVIPKRKYSFRRDSNPRSMNYEANSLPLIYLTCWWMFIKVDIKSQIVYKSTRQVYAIVTKWHIVNNFEQNAVQK